MSLEKVQEKLEYTLSVLISANVMGANASLQSAKEDVREALTELTAYMESTQPKNIDYKALYYNSLECIRSHQTFKDREFDRMVKQLNNKGE